MRIPETAIAYITKFFHHVFTPRKYHSLWLRTGNFLLSEGGIKYWLFILETMSCKYENVVMSSLDAMSNLMRHCHACGDEWSLQGLMFFHSHEYTIIAQLQICCQHFITLLIVCQLRPTTLTPWALNVFISHLNENDASVLGSCVADSILGTNDCRMTSNFQTLSSIRCRVCLLRNIRCLIWKKGCNCLALFSIWTWFLHLLLIWILLQKNLKTRWFECLQVIR